MATYSDQQRLNAELIVRVGHQVGASERDILIALMTALQESDLTNMAGGDRDSAGLFQQRPSQGWGDLDEVTNPEYAARTFFLGKPGNPGLLSIGNRDSLALTAAAQKVQRSAYPDAYAKHENAALELMGGSAGLVTPTVNGAPGAPVQLTDATAAQAKPTYTEPSVREIASEATITPTTEGVPESAQAADAPLGTTVGAPLGMNVAASPGIADVLDFMPQVKQVDQPAFVQEYLGEGGPFAASGKLATGRGADVVNMARGYLGTPYAWGGNSYEGIDCSGLVQQVFRGIGIELPRLSADQARAGERIDMKDLQPGDLVAWDNSTRNRGADHIAIYAGNGMITEAPRPGLNVRTRQLDEDDYNGWGVRLTRGN